MQIKMDLKTLKRLIRLAIPAVIVIILILIVVFGLQQKNFFNKPQTSSSLPFVSEEDLPELSKILDPLIERTEKAYEKIKNQLPYDDPKKTFSVKYIPAAKLFDVAINTSSWQEYAQIRKGEGYSFFRNNDIDPCQININWGASKEFLQTPLPSGLDFGC